MTYMIVLAVIVLFYFLTKNYNADDYTQKIHVNEKQTLKGDLREHEAGLLVALMAKVAKADGRVSELEAELLGLTFSDIARVFEESERVREELKAIYQTEMQTFDNTLVISKKYLKLTQNDYAKRLKVMEYLLNLAFIDGEFSQTERMINEDISDALEIRRADFERMIEQFKTFYTHKAEQKRYGIQNAYDVLGVSPQDDMESIKKKYRALVKEYHPDILMGQGKDQSMIDAATAKLQEINEAYETIKKEKS
ncbi:DnaJ domain-containing protein [Sulfurospirillum cavolei]|uniref:DnaJ domain-containing protein n=1 Tax=Sulfurospirillum cavolei TaxID=366522 RepID=UPI0005A6DB51|nr:DnaJ domain-containing protein [Sulfurospirillum cavolei]